MAKCDLCDKVVEHYKLVPLLLVYQSYDIKDVCSSCEAKVNKMHGKLLSLALNLKNNAFKDWLKIIKAKQQAEGE